MEKLKSAEVRARMSHPIIDSDGHTVEFLPAFIDVLKEVAGPKLADNYLKDGGFAMSMRWYEYSPKERLENRPTRPAWWLEQPKCSKRLRLPTPGRGAIRNSKWRSAMPRKSCWSVQTRIAPT